MKRLGGASWKGLRRGGACEGARSPVWPGFRRGGRCGFHKVVACKAGITSVDGIAVARPHASAGSTVCVVATNKAVKQYWCTNSRKNGLSSVCNENGKSVK